MFFHGFAARLPGRGPRESAECVLIWGIAERQYLQRGMSGRLLRERGERSASLRQRFATAVLANMSRWDR